MEGAGKSRRGGGGGGGPGERVGMPKGDEGSFGTKSGAVTGGPGTASPGRLSRHLLGVTSSDVIFLSFPFSFMAETGLPF